jgi:hypothetical protein
VEHRHLALPPRNQRQSATNSHYSDHTVWRPAHRHGSRLSSPHPAGLTHQLRANSTWNPGFASSLPAHLHGPSLFLLYTSAGQCLALFKHKLFAHPLINEPLSPQSPRRTGTALDCHLPQLRANSTWNPRFASSLPATCTGHLYSCSIHQQANA